MSILRNTIANVAGSVIPLAVAMLTVPMYLHLIGEERYGVLATIWVLLGYFGVFDFGIGKATARQIAQINSESGRSDLFSTVLVLTLFLGLLGGALLWLSSKWVLFNLFTLEEDVQKEVLGSIAWLPIALTLTLLNSTMQGALQARERFMAINSVGMVGDSLAQLFPLFVAWLGYVDIDILFPTVLSARLITSVLLFMQCGKHVPLENKLRIDFSQIRPLFIYGGWASALSMMGPLMAVMDRMVIGAITGAKGVTLFTIPFNLVTRLSVLSNSYGAVLFPKLAALPGDESKALAADAGGFIVAFTTPLAIIALALVHPFLILWLGHNFSQRCAGIGELILLGVWISGAVMPYTYWLIAEATLKKKILLVSLLELPLYFLLLYFGTKYFGALGAAGAWSLRILIDAIFMLIIADVRLKNLFSLPSIFLLIVAAFVAFYFDVDELLRWFLIMMLFSLSLAIHRKVYVDAYHLLFPPNLLRNKI